MPERIEMSSSDGIAANMERLKNALQPTSETIINMPFLSSTSPQSLTKTTEMSSLGRKSEDEHDGFIQNTLKGFDGSFILRPSGILPFNFAKSNSLESHAGLLNSPFNFHPATIPSIYSNPSSRLFSSSLSFPVEKMSPLSNLLKSTVHNLSLKSVPKDVPTLTSQIGISDSMKSKATYQPHINESSSVFHHRGRSPSPTDGKLKQVYFIKSKTILEKFATRLIGIKENL